MFFGLFDIILEIPNLQPKPTEKLLKEPPNLPTSNPTPPDIDNNLPYILDPPCLDNLLNLVLIRKPVPERIFIVAFVQAFSGEVGAEFLEVCAAADRGGSDEESLEFLEIGLGLGLGLDL